MTFREKQEATKSLAWGADVFLHYVTNELTLEVPGQSIKLTDQATELLIARLQNALDHKRLVNRQRRQYNAQAQGFGLETRMHVSD